MDTRAKCPFCGQQGTQMFATIDDRRWRTIWGSCRHFEVRSATGEQGLGPVRTNLESRPDTGWLQTIVDPNYGQIVVLDGKMPAMTALVAPLAPTPIHNTEIYSRLLGVAKGRFGVDKQSRWVKAELLRLISQGGPAVAYQIMDWIAPPSIKEVAVARVVLLGAFLATWPTVRGLISQEDRALICDQTMFIA